ncbi:hypothetical protein IQ244_22020 [Nostoc sp. LEGE 06077]|nr:hypothetical protein [Nostoc sp. LEGE 06077]MBE9209163.1 hypothetical protein [Nostoc sp. LEGE 06077]
MSRIFPDYTKISSILVVVAPQSYEYSLFVGYMPMKFSSTQRNAAIAPC